MKLALCLSGQPRFHDGASYESLSQQILSKYDTDVFFHTWYLPNYDYPCAPWSGIQSKIQVRPTVIAELVDMYRPKKYVVEPPRDFPQYCRGTYLSMNLPSMLYSLHVANRLRAEHSHREQIRYDWVIRARFDTLLGDFPDVARLARGCVYVPDNCPNPEVVNDNFSVCDGALADEVYNIFPVLDRYLHLEFSAETTWTAHLTHLGVEVTKLAFSQSMVRA